jgi:hypothetical protein
MNPILEATETGCVTDEQTVRDYDELPERAKAALPAAVERDAVSIPEAAADDFTDGEIVRFTGYYRVSIGQ